MLFKKKKWRPVGNFTVASTSGKLKNNNIISSSFRVLTGSAQQVLAPVGAQLETSFWNPDRFLIKPVLRNLMEMAVKMSLTLSTLGLTPLWLREGWHWWEHFYKCFLLKPSSECPVGWQSFAHQMWQQFSVDMQQIQRKLGYSVVCVIPARIFEAVFCAVLPYVSTSDVTTATAEVFGCAGLLNFAAFAATAGLNPVLLGVNIFLS